MASHKGMQGEFQLKYLNPHRYKCCLVKLTDSALKAIEEFSKSRPYAVPSIQFNKSESVIKIPTIDEDTRVFKFTSSETRGNLECVKYFSGTAERLGLLSSKIVICASDDTYQMAREKISSAREEELKVSTKQLETFGRNKITKRRPPVRLTTPITKDSQTFRKHVIQILAIRPYKRAELILKVRKDGVISKSDEVGSSLDLLLKDIATLNPSSGQYSLLKSLWGEVNPDWQLLSVHDRQLLKRRVQSGATLEEPSPKKMKAKLDQAPSALASSTSKMPDYFNNFVPICNMEQRAAYKEEFTSIYNEYLKLHAIVTEIWVPFETLEAKLKLSKPDTEDFKLLKSELDKEYRKFKSDRAKVELKTKFQYLHGKLGHIKRLVTEWDTSQAQFSD